MGSHQSSSDQFSQANWREVSSPFSEVTQYENCTDRNIHIERHRIRTTSQVEFDKIRELSFIRKHNPRWVAALYFQEEEPEDAEFCASKYEASLFLQKIPIRLCDLRNIPFPDVLHLYDQALSGFYELARVVGCFPVESDYIGINEHGVVKVWAGPKWSQITVRGGAVSQEDMVRGIVECLEECIDKQSMPPQNPSIRNFLYRTADRIDFEQAITELKNFSKTTPGGIPIRLHSIEENPGRYDTQRERLEQRYLSNTQVPPNYFNSQSSSQIPNHFSPRFSAQREHGVQEQITTFRRVDSLSNEPIHRQPPVSNFAVQREARPASSIPSQGRIDRSLSNPQLLNGNNLLRPNSSLKQLDPSIYPSSHRVSIGSHYSPEVSQQAINNAQPIIYHQVPFQRPPILVAVPIPQDVRVVNQQNGQAKIQYVSDPPSQADLPMNPVLHQDIQPPQLRPQNSFSQEQPRVVSRKNTIDGQSIIMQLYTSQDNTALSPNTPIGDTKRFGNNVKRSESYHVDLKKFDSATVINDSQPSSMRGIPHTQVKYQAPNAPAKCDPNNLNSIQEVHTEHYWKENGSSHKEYANVDPESLTHLDHPSHPTSPIVFRNNYAVIDENDGKSSDDFLRKLKEMSHANINHSLPGSTYQSIPGSTVNGNSFEKKKSVGFAETRDVIQIDGSRKREGSYQPNEYNFGRSAESKQEAYMNDYYDSRLFPAVSEGHPGIDPDIWADLQRYKQ